MYELNSEVPPSFHPSIRGSVSVFLPAGLASWHVYARDELENPHAFKESVKELVNTICFENPHHELGLAHAR